MNDLLAIACTVIAGIFSAVAIGSNWSSRT